jgi:hypothetical protein
MLVGFAPALAQPIDEQFNDGVLNAEALCPCQIDMDNDPVTFPFDKVDSQVRYAQIQVNDDSLGGNRCLADAPRFECGKPEAATALTAALVASLQTGTPIPPDLAAAAQPEVPDLPESLGPSFFAPQGALPGAVMSTPQTRVTAVARRKDPYCTDAIELRAHRHHEDDECIQRQELRLMSKQIPDQPRSYSFRFRMPPAAGLPDRVNSIRWVIAQWKEELLSTSYTDKFGPDWGPSPFLALRFDNGMLHVTVQDQDCRCAVASASPGANKLWPANPDGCQHSDPGSKEGKMCTPEFAVTEGDQILSSALGDWVELKFEVQASRTDNATIKVWDGDHLVVTVSGKIGYDYFVPPKCKGECDAKPKKTTTKFKIGHYRDYMPFPATMDIDWLKVEDVH